MTGRTPGRRLGPVAEQSLFSLHLDLLGGQVAAVVGCKGTKEGAYAAHGCLFMVWVPPLLVRLNFRRVGEVPRRCFVFFKRSFR